MQYDLAVSFAHASWQVQWTFLRIRILGQTCTPHRRMQTGSLGPFVGKVQPWPPLK